MDSSKFVCIKLLKVWCCGCEKLYIIECREFVTIYLFKKGDEILLNQSGLITYYSISISNSLHMILPLDYFKLQETECLNSSHV